MRQVLLDMPGPISGRRRAAPGRPGADPERRLVLHGVRRRLPRRPGAGPGPDHLERRRLAHRADRERPLGYDLPQAEHPDVGRTVAVDDRPRHVRRSRARPALGVEPQPRQQQLHDWQRAAAADRHRHQRPLRRPQHPHPPHPGSVVHRDDRARLLHHARRRPGRARDAARLLGVDRRQARQRRHPGRR